MKTLGIGLVALSLVPSVWVARGNRDMPHHGMLLDDAVYVAQGKAVAQGNYRMLSLPGEPAQIKYPPLYPLLLSVVWMLAPSYPENLPALALVSWLLLPVALGAVYWVLRDMVGGAVACGVCCVVALTPCVVFGAVNTLSELAYVAVLMAGLKVLGMAGETV